MIDESVLKSAILGDKKAFKTIYEVLFDNLWAYVQSRVHNRDITNDILSEAFLSLFENIRSVKHTKAIKNYLYKIAYNKLINYYKSEKCLSFDDSIGYKIRIEVENSPKKKIKFDIEKLLKKLPGVYQEVLRLRFISNLKIKEVSEILNKSENNIKVIQNRALKKAKEIAKKDFNFLYTNYK